MPVEVFIGIGSNLAEPEQQVRRALYELGGLPATRLLAWSRLYRSRPMGPADQPDYVNAAALLSSGLEPEPLLDRLQALEAAHGRVREGERWGPRTLDLDLLLYGDQVIGTPRLTVPHPGLRERAFVLYPLADLKPDLVLPDGTLLADLVRQVPPDGLDAIEPSR